MYNGNIISNCICIKERLKQWVNNYIFLVLNAFHHVQASTLKVFKRKKVHFTTKINLKFQANKKILFIKSAYQNGTRSSIVERSIYVQLNKTKFVSESSE